MVLQDFFYILAIYTTIARAIPSIAFPINSQVPPVARTSKPFSYTFSPSTFFSNFPITYTLSTGPNWLSLDGPTRTLSGTPSRNDIPQGNVVGVPISITATDSTGSTYLNSTLVISNNEGPIVRIPSSSQLPGLGTFTSPATLLYHPSVPFKITFDPATFSGSGLNYYAVSGDNTPLPSWVNFVGSSLTFSGQTPDYASLIQPPQTFGIQLIASDVEGFAGASISFEIEVGIHLLAINEDGISIEVVAGQDVEFTGLAAAIQIDGRQAQRSELVSVIAKSPAWLNFNQETLAFSGTVPNDAASLNFTVSVVDIYEDTATVTIPIIVTSSAIFKREIEDLNVTQGAAFKYDLTQYLFDPSDVDITVNFSPVEPWLNFNTNTSILSGNIPDDFNISEVTITINAKSKNANASASQTFGLFIAKAGSKPSVTGSGTITTSPTAVTSSTTSSTITAAVSSTQPQGSPRQSIILAITIPLVLLFICMLVVLCCCIRRRRKMDEEQTGTISKSEISLPRDDDEESVVEIIPVTRAPTPEPLQLDTSDFGRPTSTIIMLEAPPKSPKRKSHQGMQKSYTASALSDNRFSRILQESNSAGNRGRSFSDNALQKSENRKTENSWSTTQDSTRSTIPSLRRNSSYRISRTYSNYSRKGHARRSARIISTRDIRALQSNIGPPPSEPLRLHPTMGRNDSILNLHDNNFSFLPIDNFSVIPTTEATFARISTDQKPSTRTTTQRNSRARSTRRHSRFLPNFSLPQSTGLGHGRRDSISPLSSVIESKRDSLGHGQSPPSFLSRDSRTWRTIATTSSGPNTNATTLNNRESVASCYTRYPPDTPGLPLTNRYSNVYKHNQRMSIRLVPKSSSDASNIYSSIIDEGVGVGEERKTSSSFSSSSRTSRPVSRRVGSSPFFAGNPLRGSRKNKRKSSYGAGFAKRPPTTMRTSYADSPTVPEEVSSLPSRTSTIPHASAPGLEESIMHGLRNVSDEAHVLHPRDSFGISYGLAREGTRQLRSYIERRMTRGSFRSFDSRDSRFESAEQSLLNLSHHNQSHQHQQQNQHEQQEEGPIINSPQSTLEPPPSRGKLYAHDGDDFSGSSWETLHTPLPTNDKSRGELSEFEESMSISIDGEDENEESNLTATARIAERGRASLVSSVSNAGASGSGSGSGSGPGSGGKRISRIMDRKRPGRERRREADVVRGSPDVRIYPGKARRPVSVDVDAGVGGGGVDRKRSSRGIMIDDEGRDEYDEKGGKENENEMEKEKDKENKEDYTAYI